MLNNILRIARKEFASFFASPIAFIFLGTFLLVTLFTFFWVETYFARNIADVRPLFEWMPILLIFLVAAISMRMWSEERRAGTLEFLLTMPVKPVCYVFGKFFACLGLVAVALLLTFPLPITVSLLGDLDWGPVFGGYIAALFLASAYIAIGLFVSSRTDSQIVSLIVTVVVCSLFYLLGAGVLTDIFGGRSAELLKLLGSGSRFESITRGVIDLRDLYYYISLVGLFLTLNVFVLEWLRWAGNARNATHKRWGVVTALLAANFLAANVWLTPVGWMRADVTAGNMYSISDTTRNYLGQLREPLLIRGYFSAQTHPLLAPLMPQLRDLMQEYAIAGKGRVKVEIVDPADDPKLEQEAGETYSIQPVPFQIASKYQAGIVNSYFDILIKYGDKHETLGFRDLIEVKTRGVDDIDVRLRNPEYNLTQSIKKVIYAYQASGQLFTSIPNPVLFKGYISSDNKLPDDLKKFRESLNEVLDEFQKEAGDKFSVEILDPDANDGEVAKILETEYGFRPMSAGPFNPNTFWFYLTLEGNDQTVLVPFPEVLSKRALKRGMETSLKRFSTGFLKTVALYLPPAPQHDKPGGKELQFNWLRGALEQEHSVTVADLEGGVAPENADLLMLAAPHQLDDKQLFAVDQFLMQGGTVIVATSPYDINLMASLTAREHTSGLHDWLVHHGINIEQKLVMDTQNNALPVPVQRNVGGFIVQETRMIDYPYFVDIRESGINEESGIAAGLNQLTMNWASPIVIDKERNASRKLIPLLHSSERSWASTNLSIEPDTSGARITPPSDAEPGPQLLAAAVEGSFESFFKGKPSPMLSQDSGESTSSKAIGRVIEKSPETSRLVVFASETFLSDQLLGLASRAMGTQYVNPLQLAANAVDWSLEEQGLLAIRGRTHFSRTLKPLDKNDQMFWEYLNYGLALTGLLLIWVVRRQTHKRKQQRYQAILAAQ